MKRSHGQPHAAEIKSGHIDQNQSVIMYANEAGSSVNEETLSEYPLLSSVGSVVILRHTEGAL